MVERDLLQVEYTTRDRLVDFVSYGVESVSLGFDRWDEEFVQGPGLYFVIVTGDHAGGFADPLGENRWPVDIARIVTRDLDGFVEAARFVGFNRDGAVIISADGTVQRQMVRIKSPSDEAEDEERVNYADWMGTKHLSAIEVSIRPDVLATITLSEESGRMTIFRNGTFDDYPRSNLGGVWRPVE
ncbi:MAG: diadenylate cyclase [Halodesulfurarchaeum sp.]